ncbi:MAG: hypothetical protein JWM50_1607 [Microbacteriaceae bacterium]|jgi:hypothetical protein|nr:hypothetical protein [Microbacteriaceae bacterium]
MSIIANHHEQVDSTAATAAVSWTAEQTGLWVARRNDTFVGMIEARWGSGFAATTRLAKSLGTFSTVEEAQRALEESLAA